MSRKTLAIGLCSFTGLTVAVWGGAQLFGARATHVSAAYQTSRPESSATADSQASGQDERALRALSQRVNQLQIDQAALRAQLAQAESEQHAQPAESEPAQVAAEQAELEARDRARTEHIAHTFDQHLDQEEVDEAWSKQQLASIASAFADPAAGNGKLVRSECAATLCKVELMHESVRAAELFVATSGTLAPFMNSKGFYRLEETTGEGVKMAFYSVRQGHDFPPF